MTTITIVDPTVTRDLSHGQIEITNTEDTTITTPINMMNSVGIKQQQQMRLHLPAMLAQPKKNKKSNNTEDIMIPTPKYQYDEFRRN